MLFHGWGGGQNDFIADATVTSQANQKGFILVAPAGLGSGEPDNTFNSWTFSGSASGLDGDGGDGIEGAICDFNNTPDYSYASCDGFSENSCSWTQCQQDDVAFTAALLEHVGNRMCVDTDNVFASGGSNGGMFTWELGQNPEVAPLFRAIAPLIGLPHRGYVNGKGKNEDMPVLLVSMTPRCHPATGAKRITPLPAMVISSITPELLPLQKAGPRRTAATWRIAPLYLMLPPVKLNVGPIALAIPAGLES